MEDILAKNKHFLMEVEQSIRLANTEVTHQALTKVLPVALLASVPATIVSALTGGAFITSAIERATFWSASIGWFTGDLSGLVLVLPVLLCWLAPGAPSIKFYSKIEIIERTGIAAIFAAIGFLVIAYMTEEKQISLIFPYLVFPVLIWTAIRLGMAISSQASSHCPKRTYPSQMLSRSVRHLSKKGRSPLALT